MAVDPSNATHIDEIGIGAFSGSDGEVAHRWLDRRGRKGLEDLDGMFALAHWSQRDRRLLLARDRLGIKPLYYALWRGGLVFASQARALLELPFLSARLNPEALADYLAYGYVPFDRCLFAGIWKLPPAHALIFEPDRDRFEVRRQLRPRVVDSDDLGQRTDREPAGFAVEHCRRPLGRSQQCEPVFG